MLIMIIVLLIYVFFVFMIAIPVVAIIFCMCKMVDESVERHSPLPKFNDSNAINRATLLRGASIADPSTLLRPAQSDTTNESEGLLRPSDSSKISE